MKIIGRYVLKEHVGPFFFASTALTSLMLLQYLAKRFGDLVGKGLPTGVIVEFLLLSIPFTVAMTLPMAVLVAVLYAFSRLAAENEITAMKASGVGMRSVLAPVLLGGVGMSLVMLAFNDQVLPRSNHRLAVLQLDIFRTKPTFALREQVLNTVKEGQLYLWAGDIDEGSSRMTDVIIYDLSDPMHRRTIEADSGTLGLAENRTDLELILYDGVMREVPNNKSSDLTRMFYERNRLRVKGVFSSFQQSQTGTVSKGDREMSVCEMERQLVRQDYELRQAEHDLRLVEFDRNQQRGAPPTAPQPREHVGLAGAYCRLLGVFSVADASAAVPAAATQRPGGAAQTPTPGSLADSLQRVPSQPLPDIVRKVAPQTEQLLQSRFQDATFRVDQARRERNRYAVEIHKKFSLAAACVIFVLIGAPIAVRFPRGGVGLVIGVSFAIFGLYYVGLIGGESLADKAYLPPWVAMWAANIVLLIVGLVLAARMGRESSTSRGGDFAELVATMRARVFGWMRRFGVAVERRRT